MGTIDSKKLNQALAKAKNVGLVEEACTIGGCDLVFRSLRSEDYTAVLLDCDGLSEEEYIHRYQKGHIARAIVELNGVDLRDMKFVTVDEQDPSGETKKVKLELHRYLTQHMLDTWGKESLDVAFRKLGDVLDLAERRAKDGINFIAPDESTEDKYRRLLLETRGAEKGLPSTLLDKILDEQGLMRKTTAEEFRLAQQRTEQLAREQQEKAQADKEEPAAVPVTETTPVPELPPELPPDSSQSGQQSAPQSGEARRPLPPDPHATLQQAIAMRKVLDVPVVRSEQADPKPTSRGQQIAALEGTDCVPPDVSAAVSLQPDSHEVVEIRHAPIDVEAAAMIMDTPPVAGINPRFRPPQRV